MTFTFVLGLALVMGIPRDRGRESHFAFCGEFPFNSTQSQEQINGEEDSRHSPSTEKVNTFMQKVKVSNKRGGDKPAPAQLQLYFHLLP